MVRWAAIQVQFLPNKQLWGRVRNWIQMRTSIWADFVFAWFTRTIRTPIFLKGLMVLPVVLSLFGPASSSLEDSESDDEGEDNDVISSHQRQNTQSNKSKDTSALTNEEGGDEDSEVKKPVLGSNGAFRESTIWTKYLGGGLWRDRRNNCHHKAGVATNSFFQL